MELLQARLFAFRYLERVAAQRDGAKRLSVHSLRDALRISPVRLRLQLFQLGD